MPDKKEDNLPDDKPTFARDIDPKLETKVDSYMDPQKPDAIASPDLPQAPAENTSGAPLLPTEKLSILNDTPPEEVAPLSAVQPPSSTVEPTDELGLETPETAKAVDDIAANESDQILASEDEARKALETPTKKQNILKRWWHNKKARWITIWILILAIAAVFVVPTSRYFVLNTAGVRASSSLSVLDQTGQPLKNAEVYLADQTATTDLEGNVYLQDLKLGEYTLTIKKLAFADVKQDITVGWGSNPLGDFKLTATGTEYKFILSNYLSGKPVAKAEATYQTASGLSNEKGELVLTVPQTNQENIAIEINAPGYRQEKLTLPVATTETQEIKLVSDKKHAFISKRSGTYDLYAVDIDGKNEEKILTASGNDSDDRIMLLAHPTKDVVALVSIRENPPTQDGTGLSTLSIVDLKTKNAPNIVDSENIQVVDFIGDKLVYVKVAQGASEDDKQRHRLMAYDIEASQDKEIASTNYFNDVMVAQGKIYYAPAEHQVNGQVGFFSINPDGKDRVRINNKEAWNFFRTGYDTINVSSGNNWFEYNLLNNSFTQLSRAPSNLKSRIYIEGPSNNRSLWVDERDGKGVVLTYTKSTAEDKVITSQSGLKNPVQWLDSGTVVYRVKTSQETADYVVSLDGGEPKKIKDVTDTAGLDRWYYY